MSSPRVEESSKLDELKATIDRLDVLAGELLVRAEEDQLSAESIQKLMTIAVKLYVARRISSPDLTPFTGGVVTATDVAVATTQMLSAVNLELFELALWNGWGKD
jgi:hypothetical protein